MLFLQMPFLIRFYFTTLMDYVFLFHPLGNQRGLGLRGRGAVRGFRWESSRHSQFGSSAQGSFEGRWRGGSQSSAQICQESLICRYLHHGLPRSHCQVLFSPVRVYVVSRGKSLWRDAHCKISNSSFYCVSSLCLIFYFVFLYLTNTWFLLTLTAWQGKQWE